MKKRTEQLLWLGILGSGAIALFAKSAGAAPSSSPKPPLGNVQTATVGNRLYSVNRLGQGNYLVTLISTGGVLETTPINYSFSQTGPLGEFGPAGKVAQLKIDLNNMDLRF